MSKEKANTHVVTHDSLYLRVEGKLQEMKRGDYIHLTEKQLGNKIKRKFVAAIKDFEAVTVGDGDGKEVKKLKKEVEKLTKELEEATKPAVATGTK